MINLVNSLPSLHAAASIEQAHSELTPFEAMMHGFGLGSQADHAGQTGQERSIIIVGGAPQDRAIIIVGGQPQGAAHAADSSRHDPDHFRLQTAMSVLNPVLK